MNLKKELKITINLKEISSQLKKVEPATYVTIMHKPKAVANGLVGQVLAGPLFLKVKTKFHFTKCK